MSRLLRSKNSKMKQNYPSLPPPFPRSDLGNQKNVVKYSYWDWLGRVLFFVTWPGIWLVIRFTPPRTRAVIEHNGEILLLRDWLGNGDWSLPGGGLHRQENPLRGVLREVYEETGMQLKPNDVQWASRFQMKSAGISVRYEVFYARMKQRPKVVISSKEISQARWVAIERLADYRVSSATQAILDAFVQS